MLSHWSGLDWFATLKSDIKSLFFYRWQQYFSNKGILIHCSWSDDGQSSYNSTKLVKSPQVMDHSSTLTMGIYSNYSILFRPCQYVAGG